MRKIFTLCLGVLFATGVFAQKPTDLIKKTETKPVIDGVKDEGLWDEATVNLMKPYTGETPTLGESGETNWRALWDDDGIYVLVTVADDVYAPIHIGTGGDGYKFDKVEIYIDANFVLEDGKGPNPDGNGGGNGHYQFADDIKAGFDTGKEQTRTDGVKYSFTANDPNWVAEYFIPFTKLKTGDGTSIDIEGAIGFDVTIADNDATSTPNSPVRNRAVWANDNSDGKGESWTNMDACGIITLEGASVVEVDEITISVDGSITADNQTLQISSIVLPEDATDKSLIWEMTTGDGKKPRAKISPSGLITPVINETFVVKAWDADRFIESNEVEISISGQIPSIGELSWIVDGFFDNADENGKVSSVWDVPASGVVTDGVLVFGPDSVLTNQWDYHLLQQTHIPFEMKDMDFIISFKAWAEAPRNMPLVLEDAFADDAQWDSYFTSTNEYWDGDKTYVVPLTTEPTVFKLHANFGPMKETTIQNFNWQVGKETPKIYLDSVYIISVADMALIPTAISQKRAMESFLVYPNPATSKLTVELSAINSRVEIYNSVGVKMDEAVVMGNRHMFDVSRYSKGLYFVKANGAVVKFVK
ncbi:hypothetical protein MASR2M47_37950 [Draconibacterium sp.]|jgi:hypothetical protein